MELETSIASVSGIGVSVVSTLILLAQLAPFLFAFELARRLFLDIVRWVVEEWFELDDGRAPTVVRARVRDR